MKEIIIACDSFKESLSALQACQAVKEGLEMSFQNTKYHLIPMGDGGEGTTEILTMAIKGMKQEVNIVNHMLQPIKAYYSYNQDHQIAVMECAQGCGIDLIPAHLRDPLNSTTIGVGQMIIDALNHGAKRIVIGLGGSGTNDGGIGLLGALGAKFYDKNHQDVLPLVKNMLDIETIDLTDAKECLKGCVIEVASDVENPYIGPLGATYVFGPQKGASKEDLDNLEKCLTHFNEVVKKQYGIDLKQVKKTGAAGGLGGALYLLGASLASGIELVLDITHFDDELKNADYVFTGEGSIDSQTINGKVISGIAHHASLYHVPVIALAGRVKDADNLYDIGVTSMFSIVDEAKSLDQALKDGYGSLKDCAKNIGKLLNIK